MAVITASPNNFSKLLELQKLSVDHLAAISKNIDESLVYQRLQTIEDYLIAKDTDKESDSMARIEKIMESMLSAIETIRDSMASLRGGRNIVNNNSQSSTLVEKNSNSSTSLITQSEEDKHEKEARENKTISLLERIEENTRFRVKVKPEDAKDDSGIGLGALVTAIAVALGALVAAVKAQVKAIRYFLDLLVPDKLTKAIATRITSFVAGLSMQFDLLKDAFKEKVVTKAIAIFESVVESFGKMRARAASFLAGLSMQFDLLKDTLKEKLPKPILEIGKSIANFFEEMGSRFSAMKDVMKDKLLSAGKVFDDAVDWVKGLFGKESKLASAAGGVMSWISRALEPFLEAGRTIAGFLEGPIGTAITKVKDIFSTIGNYLAEFGKTVGKVAVVLEKFFLPLTIIMTIWDTVKGTIEGYEKEGIIGGIKGAITGFFNSLIFGPIDMIKNATAWVLGFFGANKAKEALESFNFSDLFDKFVNAVFSPLETIKNAVGKLKELFSKLADIEIPEKEIGIPGTRFNWKFGPYRPFSGLKGESTSVNSTTSEAPASTAAPAPATAKPIASNLVPASPSAAGDVSQRSNNVVAMKEDAARPAPSNIVSAPSVSNNISNTQVATLRAPVRSEDPTIQRYVSSRVLA